MPAPRTNDELMTLVQKSGLVDNQRLHTYLAKLRTLGVLTSHEPSTLSSLLIQDGILTDFQAQQIMQGKWKRFAIGKYKVLEHLGAGSQGSVYLCEHEPTHRRVAVKVLPTSLTNDPAAVERFYREARALAALAHLNIVRAYEIGQDDQLSFLVMEYVDGSSLQRIAEKCGPMAVIRAAHYLRQAALGLQHAHLSAGIVHRDLKPADVLVDRCGVVKVIDFGHASLPGEEDTALRGKHASPLDPSDYMAPEQASAPQNEDARADIYSLGATFYFCLTGYAPFRGGTTAQRLLWLQTRQPEPIRRLRPRVPEGLAALIERMMAKDPAQRPQTLQEVVDALAPYSAVPIGPPPEDEMPHLCPAALGGRPSATDDGP